jgi:VWFA-related protein
MSELLLLAGLLAQFQSVSEFVVVDVEVLQNERPVAGLRQGDFRVFDNGKEQAIAGFGLEDRELEVLLLVDVSGSTELIHEVIRTSAARAMNRLNFRDRVGLVTFAANADLAAAPTWDRLAVLRELAYLPRPEGGTELNNNIFLAARYLRQQARPGTRRAIVILTDNLGHGVVSNNRVRNELWEADTMLSGLLFSNEGFSSGNADIRPFAKDTGGDLFRYDGSSSQLDKIFEGLRQRYTLLYAKPATKAGEVRRIRVCIDRSGGGACGEGLCSGEDGLCYGYAGFGWAGDAAIGGMALTSLTHREVQDAAGQFDDGEDGDIGVGYGLKVPLSILAISLTGPV